MSLVGLLATTSLVLALAGPSATSPRPSLQPGVRGATRIPIDHDRFLYVLLLERRALPIETDGLARLDDPPLLSSLSLPEYDSDEEDPDEDQQPDPPPPPLQFLLSKDKRHGLSMTNPVDTLRNRVILQKTMEAREQQLKSLGKRAGLMGKFSAHPLARANLGRPSRADEQLPFQL